MWIFEYGIDIGVRNRAVSLYVRLYSCGRSISQRFSDREHFQRGILAFSLEDVPQRREFH